MTTEAPAGVGWTALLTAAARAREDSRPAPLVRDPWAGRFLAAHTEGPPLGGHPDDGPDRLWTALHAYFVCRTPFYDDEVTRAVAGGTRQVVLLAAGLDARAARLALPEGTTVYEVDAPDVLEFKARILDGAGLDVPRRRPVVADLRTDWAAPLRDAGFDPSRPTVWLAEGLLMYLEPGQADALLAAIRELSAPGSRLVTEYFVTTPTLDDLRDEDPEQTALSAVVVDLFRSGPDGTPPEWLARNGWHGSAVRLTDEIVRHGWAVPSKFGRPGPVDVWLVSGSLPG